MLKKIRTTCSRGCLETCGVIAHVEDGRVVKHVGDPDHEITKGFLCYKGNEFLRMFYSPRRILHPMKKTKGGWKRISWNEALDMACEKISYFRDNFGSLSIFFCKYAGSVSIVKGIVSNLFFALLGGATTRGGGASIEAGVAGQMMDFGAFGGHDPSDMMNSNSIVIWGKNPAVTHVHLIPFIVKARKKGVKVYLIDPIKTKTASYADRFFQIRPGTDGLLAIGVAKRLKDLGRMDQDFIKNYSINFESYERILDSYSMEEIAQRCELGQDVIRELAEVYSARKPTFTLPGLGPQYWRLGASNYRLIDALVAMSGNVGISGGGCNVITNGRWFRFDSMLIPDEYKPSLKRREILFPDIAKGIREMDNPPIKMAWIAACDPVAAAPGSDRSKKALSSLDFVVVVDHFLTDTADCADLFLPATTYLEEDDYVSSIMYNCLNAIRQAVPPQGEAKSDQEIFELLANRLGFGDKLCISANFWLEKLVSLFQGKGVTMEDLKRGPVRNPLVPMIPFEDRKFNTKSGKYEFITSYNFSIEEGNQNFSLRLLATKSDKVLSCQIMEEDEAEVPEIRVHPETAMQYGIGDGEKASLVSEYARVDVRVMFDADQRREVVYFPHAVWKDDGGGVNRLRGPIMTDYGNDSAFHETLVRLEK